MNKGKVELIKYEQSSEPLNETTFVYLVEHNNGDTMLQQKLTIYGNPRTVPTTWTAEIAMDDFPPQESPGDAANKLADWLERIAASIRSGEFHSFERTKYIDLDEYKKVS
ncbi:hypothetical protein [Hahella ganghwensis]|uniref:hypothetical protein n=1 Tax=Hahella ganghwensis TaxID=286420 RepID=UPI00036E5E02|nr:hypothetical protein [Hahella ganghwensis]